MTQKFKILFFSLLFPCVIWAADVDTISIHAIKMDKSIKTVIVTPEGYAKDKSYPVIYLLHGYSGNYSNWVEKVPAIKDLADTYQLIFVCPDGGYSGWYLDSPVEPDSQYESFIVKDVVHYVDENYATIAKREGRAITGLSMGGHGGLYLGIRNRDVFASAGSMSGAVDIKKTVRNYDLNKRLGVSYKKNPELWRSHTVSNLVESLKNKDLNIIIDCGVDDYLYEMNANLHQKLIKLKIDHDYIERPGKHNWEYWKNAICYQTLFFVKQFENYQL